MTDPDEGNPANDEGWAERQTFQYPLWVKVIAYPALTLPACGILFVILYAVYDILVIPAADPVKLTTLQVALYLIIGMGGLWFVYRVAPTLPMLFSRLIVDEQGITRTKRDGDDFIPWSRISRLKTSSYFGWIEFYDLGNQRILVVSNGLSRYLEFQALVYMHAPQLLPPNDTAGN